MEQGQFHRGVALCWACKDTQKFSRWGRMARALDRKRIAGIKVWRPDYAASEELCVFSRTWGQGSRKTRIREACTPRKGVWLPP